MHSKFIKTKIIFYKNGSYGAIYRDNNYIYKITLTRYPYLNLMITLFLIAPINIIGLALSKIFPKNDDLYLDNIALAKKVKNIE